MCKFRDGIVWYVEGKGGGFRVVGCSDGLLCGIQFVCSVFFIGVWQFVSYSGLVFDCCGYCGVYLLVSYLFVKCVFYGCVWWLVCYVIDLVYVECDEYCNVLMGFNVGDMCIEMSVVFSVVEDLNCVVCVNVKVVFYFIVQFLFDVILVQCVEILCEWCEDVFGVCNFFYVWVVYIFDVDGDQCNMYGYVVVSFCLLVCVVLFIWDVGCEVKVEFDNLEVFCFFCEWFVMMMIEVCDCVGKNCIYIVLFYVV